MPIVRMQHKTGNFVIIDKTCFNDPRLSLKAKGLHGYLLGLPDHWELCVKELVRHFRDGRDAINAALQELIQLGYIEKKQGVRSRGGAFAKSQHIVYEIPELACGFSDAVIPSTENPGTENPTLVNNNLNNYLTKQKRKKANIAYVGKSNTVRPAMKMGDVIKMWQDHQSSHNTTEGTQHE